MAERGQLCVGIDPHAALLAAVGARRRRPRAWRRFALAAVEAVAPYVLGRQAAVGVLRAVRQPRRRGPRARDRRARERRCAGAARRQARRHRLDLPGVRRRLPRPRVPARPPTRSRPAPSWASARSTRWSTPPAATARGVFVLALTSNKEGPEVQHAVGRRRRHGRRRRARPAARAQPGRRAARLVRRGRRRHHRRAPARTSTSTARCSRPATAPRAAPRPTCAGSSAPPRARVLASSSRERAAARPGPAGDGRRRAPRPTTSSRRRSGEAGARGRARRRRCCSPGAASPAPRRSAPTTARRCSEQQRALSDALADGSPDALLEALPIFRELAAEAPHDIADDWDVPASTRSRGSTRRSTTPGVDPAAYDPAKPPADVTEEQRAAIERGRRRAGRPAHAEDAFDGRRAAGHATCARRRCTSDAAAAPRGRRPIAAARADVARLAADLHRRSSRRNP